MIHVFADSGIASVSCLLNKALPGLEGSGATLCVAADGAEARDVRADPLIVALLKHKADKFAHALVD